MLAELQTVEATQSAKLAVIQQLVNVCRDSLAIQKLHARCLGYLQNLLCLSDALKMKNVLFTLHAETDNVSTRVQKTIRVLQVQFVRLSTTSRNVLVLMDTLARPLQIVDHVSFYDHFKRLHKMIKYRQNFTR